MRSPQTTNHKDISRMNRNALNVARRADLASAAHDAHDAAKQDQQQEMPLQSAVWGGRSLSFFLRLSGFRNSVRVWIDSGFVLNVSRRVDLESAAHDAEDATE